jgi:HAD superfamily hydrolase (TIGR01493 family)
LSSAARVRGYVFDAYGTLFDVHSIVEVGREVTADPQALSATWRQKQLEYTWLRALMGRYEDFWTVTEAALRDAIRRLALTASEAQIRRLMDAYLSLACFPEVKATLEALAPHPRGILPNGSPRMLEAAVASSGLGVQPGPCALGRCRENLQRRSRGPPVARSLPKPLPAAKYLIPSSLIAWREANARTLRAYRRDPRAFLPVVGVAMRTGALRVETSA